MEMLWKVRSNEHFSAYSIYSYSETDYCLHCARAKSCAIFIQAYIFIFAVATMLNRLWQCKATNYINYKYK